MNSVVYVVYLYFPVRDAIEIAKVFRNEDHAEAFKKELLAELRDCKCHIYVRKADFME